MGKKSKNNKIRPAARKRPSTRGRSRLQESGVIQMGRRGAGSLDTGQGRFYIAASDTQGAMHGDTVRVAPIKSKPLRRDGSIPARVTAILSRATTQLVGTYVKDGKLQLLFPLDGRLGDVFFIDAAQRSAEKHQVKQGDVVVATIAAYPSRTEPGLAVISRCLGTEDSETVDIEAVIASLGLRTSFDPQALEEVSQAHVDADAALVQDPLRRDLRQRYVVTVDPASARDFDDALSLEKRPDGSRVLGVHIADVTHYVPADSYLDIEARTRATSVYLVDRVLPMLPPALSDDVCSLRPREDRLSMSCDLTLDKEGRVTAADIYPSVIRSRHRLSYDQVDALLDAADGTPGAVDALLDAAEGATDAAGTPGASAAPGVPGPLPAADQERLTGLFQDLERIRQQREALRRKRGALDFESVESRAVLDSLGHAIGIEVRRRTRATGIVEEAMLAANEAVARYLVQNKVPAAFRVHEEPSGEALGQLVGSIAGLVDLDVSTKAGIIAGESRALQAALEQGQANGTGLVLGARMLRAMKRAHYLPENQGHFGLAAPSYCHFTSPIRRYPDLIVHRMLKLQLRGTLKAQVRKDAEAALPAVCEHSSIMERVAADAEHQTQDIKIAQYMQSRVGEAFSGMVVELAPFGMFVQLDGLGVSGLLSARELGWDAVYDPEVREFSAGKPRKRWYMGKRVAVQVASVNVHRGHVNFKLAAPDPDA